MTLKHLRLTSLIGMLALAPLLSSCGDMSPNSNVLVTASAPAIKLADASPLVVAQQTSLVVTNGTRPYTFAITSGSGTIDTVTETYTAPTTPTSVGITVTDANGLQASTAFTVVAGTANRLVVTANSTTILPSACGSFSVATTDTYSNTKAPASTVTATLTTLPTNSADIATFFSDATCTTPITTVALTAAAPSATFYAKRVSTALVQIGATATGYTSVSASVAAAYPIAPMVFGQTSSVLERGMSGPRSIASDGTAFIVADTVNHRVLIWNTIPADNTVLPDVVVGQTSLSGGGQNQGGGTSPTARTLFSPMGVSYDGQYLYVADTGNHRILIWDGLPRAHNTPADYIIGQSTFTTTPSANNGGVSGKSMSSPEGVHSDGTRLYAADTGNNRVLIWNARPRANNVLASVVLGQSTPGTNTANFGGAGPSSLSAPSAVTTSNGYLFVADRSNNRVLAWTSIPTANRTAANAAIGQGTTSTVATATTQVGMSGPSGVAATVDLGVPANTKVYVTDTTNSRITLYEGAPATNASSTRVLGQTSYTTSASNNSTSGAEALNGPRGIAIVGTKLIVADTGNNRVISWNALPTAGGPNPTVAANVVYGQPDFTTMHANNGVVSPEKTQAPRSFVRIGTNYYVADSANNRVLRFANPAADLSGIEATAVIGQQTFLQSGANNAALTTGTRFCAPSGLHTDGTRLILADECNHRVLIWNTAPTANADADIVLGQANLAGISANRGGAAAGNTLSNPGSVFTFGGKLYVTDRGNNRVLIWNDIATVTSGQAADVILGQSNTTNTGSNQGGLSAATLSQPQSVTADAARIVVADSGNHRVLIYVTAAPTTGMSATRVLGQSLLTTNTENLNGSTSGSSLSYPSGVWLESGKLLVIDRNNNRLLYWSSVPAASGQSADSIIGTYTLTLNFPRSTTSTTVVSFLTPHSVAVDGTKIYIAETGYDRILVLDKFW